MLCNDVARYLLREADEPDTLDDGARASLEAHLRHCADCRRTLEEQRAVAAVLRGRPRQRPSPEFGARLAARLDEESGWYGMADWRTWSFRLAPVAAAIWFAVFFGYTAETIPQAITIEEWTLSAAGTAGAPAVLWQPDASTDAVLETILTGQAPGSEGGTDGAR